VLDLAHEFVNRAGCGPDGLRERRRDLAERAFQRHRGGADRIEERRGRNPRRRADRSLELERSLFRLFDPGRLLDHPDLRELRAQCLEISPTGELARQLAHRNDRRNVTDVLAAIDGLRGVVDEQPGARPAGAERHEIEASPVRGLGRENARDLAMAGHRDCDALQVVGERHRVKRMDARALFAPLGPGYDRWGSVLSFGQDPRWRRFLVSRIDAGPTDTVLDVATGTAAVALELVRQKDCFVVGVDQSPEMLEEGRQRVILAAATRKIRLQEADARALPFDDGQFDALTFTYLLRYVEDPAATLRELARVVRPGGTISSLEFGVPRGVWRPLWEAWTRIGLPGAGRLIGNGWHEVGAFLHPSITGYYERWPLPRLLAAWRDAGIEDVQAKRLSLGGGIVTWGRRK
jgi:demethylmenaquinone methyltransferase / 2-methoxy-6-polyprenyl-1,4-benzoquinol methylase